MGAIEPLGWLDSQLRLQADGLSSHLDEFWPDIRDSAWIGGDAEGWERVPYWLDCAIPLAWLLDHGDLKSRTACYMDHIIDHQQGDGWLRPLVEEKALRRQARHIDNDPLWEWGQFRWFEALIAIWWQHERIRKQWLLDLAVTLQSQGFHWKSFFARWPLTVPTPKGRWDFPGHVVNNAMALKGDALWWRLSGEPGDRTAAHRMIETLEEHHEAVTGVFMGDECLAGGSPVQGTEL